MSEVFITLAERKLVLKKRQVMLPVVLALCFMLKIFQNHTDCSKLFQRFNNTS